MGRMSKRLLEKANNWKEFREALREYRNSQRESRWREEMERKTCNHSESPLSENQVNQSESPHSENQVHQNEHYHSKYQVNKPVTEVHAR